MCCQGGLKWCGRPKFHKLVGSKENLIGTPSTVWGLIIPLNLLPHLCWEKSDTLAKGLSASGLKLVDLKFECSINSLTLCLGWQTLLGKIKKHQNWYQLNLDPHVDWTPQKITANDQEMRITQDICSHLWKRSGDKAPSSITFGNKIKGFCPRKSLGNFLRSPKYLAS